MTEKQQFRKEFARKRLSTSPAKCGDQSSLQVVDFRLQESLTDSPSAAASERRGGLQAEVRPNPALNSKTP
jgi:hypothetical protein